MSIPHPKGMKRVIFFILCAGVGGFGAFQITRWAGSTPPAQGVAPLTWLKSEFHLSTSQMAAIETLHHDYQPVCRDHCEKIHQARARLAAAKPASATGEANAELAELARVEAVCRDATRAHLERVAALMAPADGARFLDLMLPKLAGPSADASCDLK
jgi:hypothetical protein